MDSLLWFVIVGLVAGFLAGRVMKGKGSGFLINLIVGVAGAILGGWLVGNLGVPVGSGIVGSIITAFLGAVILLFIISLIRKK